MKKFKTRVNCNYFKIILFIVLSIIFIILSFTKLNISHNKLISILTSSFKDDHTRVISLTNNLDYLINTYSFIDNKKIYNNSTEKEKVLYYYKTGD